MDCFRLLSEGGNEVDLKEKEVYYPEDMINENMTPDDLVKLLQAFYKSRAMFMAMAPQDDLVKVEMARKIVFDQVVVLIRGLIECELIRNHGKETGAIIHTLALEWPKALVTIHTEQSPYDIQLVPFMVEHVPSMQILLDKLDVTKTFNMTILACLACKHPSPKTFEAVKFMFTRQIAGMTAAGFNADMIHIVRLIVTAFPVLVESLLTAPCMAAINQVGGSLSEDIERITAALSRPIYRKSFSCINLH